MSTAFLREYEVKSSNELIQSLNKLNGLQSECIPSNPEFRRSNPPS